MTHRLYSCGEVEELTDIISRALEALHCICVFWKIFMPWVFTMLRNSRHQPFRKTNKKRIRRPEWPWCSVSGSMEPGFITAWASFCYCSLLYHNIPSVTSLRSTWESTHVGLLTIVFDTFWDEIFNTDSAWCLKKCDIGETYPLPMLLKWSEIWKIEVVIFNDCQSSPLYLASVK